MTRPRPLRLWAVALWTLCLLVAAGSVGRNPDRSLPGSGAATTVGIVPATSDPAVLPARIVDDVGVPAHPTPLRLPLMAAVLTGLVALPAVLRRRPWFAGALPRPLRSRRHTIAVRAPPSLRFA